MNLLKEIIYSFTTVAEKQIGMPIGNLTSQIFANIYLNELDRFVTHQLKPKAYLRYGDDFILIEDNFEKLKLFRVKTVNFLENELRLTINSKSDRMTKSVHGLKFLGVKLWSFGRTLNKRSLKRATERLNCNNIPSYSGLIRKNCNKKRQNHFNWIVSEKILTE